MSSQSLLNDELTTMQGAAHRFPDEETETRGREMTDPGPTVRFREETVPGCKSPYSRPPTRGPEGTPGLALSLPFSPPRAVLTQAVMEAWAGWAGER